ncbi:TonB-dependent receptor domain-containing protein [Proteus vulgaris]|uniref:TonB-dependent receptor domain-containing protein n=1 Tax=Proteus vulgaris TaxID=585 RepID=UPI003523607D
MDIYGMCMLKKHFKYSGIATALCLLYSPIASAHAENTQTDSLTVIGHKYHEIEHNFQSTIETSTPQAKTASTTGEMLKEVAGITLSGTGVTNGANILMRGYDQKGVKILVDGIHQPLENTMNNLGGVFLDPSLIKSINVKHGSASTVHGEGAMGGVVAFNTLDPQSILAKNKNLGAKLFSSYSSADRHFSYGGIIAGQHKLFSGLISYTQRQRGPILLADGQKMDNNESINNYFAKIYLYPTNNQTFIFSARHYDNSGEQREVLYRMSGYGKNKSNQVYRDTQQKNYSLTHHYAPESNSWIDLTTHLYYSQFNIEQTFLTDVKLTESELKKNLKGKIGTFEARTQSTYGGKLENYTNITPHNNLNLSVILGTEAYRQKMTSNEKAKNFPLAKMDYAATWLQSTLSTPLFPLSLTAGVRYHYYESSPNKKIDSFIYNHAASIRSVDENKLMHKASYRGTTENVKLTFSATPWLQLYTSYSTAFRAPTLSEMFNDSLHYNKGRFLTSYWIPNPYLNPERNRTWEYGGKFSFQQLLSENDALEIKVAYFDTLSKDYISYAHWMGTILGKQSLKAYNIANVYIEGADIALRYTHTWLSAGLSYNRTNTFQLTDSETISPVRPEILTAFIQVPIAKTPFSLGWSGQFASATDSKSSYKGMVAPHNRGKEVTRLQEVVQQFPGYAVHDFSLSYQSKKNKDLQATLMLANAFNYEYFSTRGVPQEGRNIKMSVSYRW